MSALHIDRHARQLKRWNITEEMWREVWEHQQGKCYTCRKSFSSTRLACVDHDHESGLWRGLLCTDCNYAIGERHDDADWFRRCADYLDNPPAQHWHHYVPGSIGEHRGRSAPA